MASYRSAVTRLICYRREKGRALRKTRFFSLPTNGNNTLAHYSDLAHYWLDRTAAAPVNASVCDCECVRMTAAETPLQLADGLDRITFIPVHPIISLCRTRWKRVFLCVPYLRALRKKDEKSKKQQKRRSFFVYRFSLFHTHVLAHFLCCSCTLTKYNYSYFVSNTKLTWQRVASSVCLFCLHGSYVQ